MSQKNLQLNQKTQRNSRRLFLQGLGVAMGLPWLEAIQQSTAYAADATVATPPQRMAFVFFPNGAIMPDWRVEGSGTDFRFSKTLKSLESLKADINIITGLAHDKARANGDGGGDHARCAAAFLTASQPRKTGGADIHVGVSVDQVAAQKVGSLTPLPSLELGIEGGRQAGACDSGYSCAYQSNISWRSASQPMAKEINPKLAFERLFGMTVNDIKKRQERDFYRSSILDIVSEDARHIQHRLSRNDRQKVEEYFTSVREIEQRIGRSMPEKNVIPKDFEVPEGIPQDTVEHIRLMYDIMVLAFQTDTTRIATYMLANEGTNKRYEHLAVKEGHHQLSHHRNDQAKMDEIQKIDQFLTDEFARFLRQLKATSEGNGNLLDHSMIVFGSGISDANRHQHDDLPVVMAGKAGGSINTGRHIVLGRETPMANLYCSMLDRMNCPVEQFGDSDGKLNELS